jgi:hypothetical protein
MDFHHTYDLMRCSFEDALKGPAVSAAPGYFLLYACDPERAPAPILAWRIGSKMVLPVIGLGCVAGQHYVLYPDGSVRPHFHGYDCDPGTFKNFAEWHDMVTGQGDPKQERQATTIFTDDMPL